MNFFQHRTNARGVPDLLLYDSLIAPDVMLLQDGALLAAFRYRGPDMASRTPDELAGLSALANRALCLGSGWLIHVDAIRAESPGYPGSGHFPDTVTRAIDEERRLQFERVGRHYESTYYLAITYLPPMAKEERVKGWLFSGKTDRDVTGPRRILRMFEEKVTAIGELLGAGIRIERLGPTDGGCNDLLRYIRTCVTGNDGPFVTPEVPVFLQDVIGVVDLVGGIEPRLGGRHLRLLAIDGFPGFTRPGIIQALDELPFAYRWNTRLMPLDAQEATGIIGTIKKKWRSRVRGWWSQVSGRPPATINEDAQAMEVDAQAALAVAQAGDVQYAVFTSGIVLLADAESDLENQISMIRKVVGNAGFSVRVETVNALEAWCGSLPGDGYRNVRRSLLHTLNIADLLPLGSVWTGAAINPSALMRKQGATDPLLMAGTTGNTPFRLNLHVSDLGHTLMVGPTGTGKSTLLAFIAAQWFRYPGAQVFAFDKGYSLQALCRAAGGDFYDLGGDDLSLCPLQSIDSDSEVAWATEWLETLCVLQGVTVGPRESGEIRDAVKLLRTSPSRTMTELVTNLQDEQLRDALGMYTLEGSLAFLDAPEDSIRIGRFQCFEMGQMIEMGTKAVSAVLPYLFHRIRRRLDQGNGEPTLVILDEAWRFLDNAIFEAQIRDWLKTFRSLNAAVVMATQNLADVCESNIRSVIFESCPTKILLPNPEANNEMSRVYYRQLGLNDREIQIVRDAIPKREYYVTSSDGRRKFETGLGNVALAFCAPTSQEQRRAIDALREKYGDRWPTAWLSSLGHSDWARYLESLAPQMAEGQKPREWFARAGD